MTQTGVHSFKIKKKEKNTCPIEFKPLLPRNGQDMK